MRPPKSKVTPLRIGLTASLILAVLHILLLGWTYQRRAAARQLDQDLEVLQENFGQLENIKQDQLDQLQLELDRILGEVAELEASFPELGAPFALIRRGQEFADSSQVELKSITRMDTSIQETASGDILREEFSLELGASLENCVSFIRTIERAGQDTVVMQYASFWPVEEHCTLELISRGQPPREGE